MVQLPEIPSDLVNLTEAASLIGVSRWTIRRMIANHQLAPYQVGLRTKVSAAEVRASVRRDGGAT